MHQQVLRQRSNAHGVGKTLVKLTAFCADLRLCCVLCFVHTLSMHMLGMHMLGMHMLGMHIPRADEPVIVHR